MSSFPPPPGHESSSGRRGPVRGLHSGTAPRPDGGRGARGALCSMGDAEAPRRVAFDFQGENGTAAEQDVGAAFEALHAAVQEGFADHGAAQKAEREGCEAYPPGPPETELADGARCGPRTHTRG